MLDDLLQEIYSLTKPGEMPRQVELCQQALKLVNQEQDPEQWASLQNSLGVSLWQNPQGDHADNLERAIAAYEAALQVRTREDFPQKWAMTQNNLGLFTLTASGANGQRTWNGRSPPTKQR